MLRLCVWFVLTNYLTNIGLRLTNNLLENYITENITYFPDRGAYATYGTVYGYAINFTSLRRPTKSSNRD